MKGRKAGGVGIVLVAIGLLIGLMFKGPGLGGSGSGDGSPDITNVKTLAPEGGDLMGDDAKPRPAGEEVGQALPYATVVIHGDGYRLSPTGDPKTGVELELSDILERVKASPGTPEGIRLRVLLHTSAREGARSDLLAALQSAGIPSEAIQEVSGFVE